MHEMSIAEGIVDIALQTLKANEGTVVHQIQVQLGKMSGVEPDSLHFCFEAVTKGTAAEGAKLELQMVPVAARCLDCDTEFSVVDYKFKCPRCHSTAVVMTTGRELRVVSIDMD